MTLADVEWLKFIFTGIRGNLDILLNGEIIAFFSGILRINRFTESLLYIPVINRKFCFH